MDQQPKIPTLKDAQKPQVKIKGMGAGLTLLDRLKQFKKKDLAFILAGLGTLFMAPLAEHFMMAPENGDGRLEQGWGKNGAGSNLFGGGSSPYENGNNSIAQGGAIGGSGDIITPLNVRDPSALVMGPGQAQQPPAGSAAPAVAPPTAPSSDSKVDYKDALAGAASRAASAAVKKSPLPVPKVALGGSGLRGLGVASGGTSASGGPLGPLGPAAGSTGGGGGDRMLAKAGPNFRGAAGPRSPTGHEGTKAGGQNAGEQFSRTGSALGGLNAAANEQIPGGGSSSAGGGSGGAGANDKGGGAAGPGGSKSVGESLAFIEAKERMMENLKLEFEKRKLKDPELLLYGIRNDILKAAGTEIGKGLTTQFMCNILNMGCPAPDSEYDCAGTPMSGAQMSKTCDAKESKSVTNCWVIDGSQATFYAAFPQNIIMTCNATGAGKGSSSGNQRGEWGNGPGGGFSNRPSPAAASVDRLCSSLQETIDTFGSSTPAPAPSTGAGPTGTAAGGATTKEAYVTMKKMAGSLLLARNTLIGGGKDGACGDTPLGAVKNYHQVIAQTLAMNASPASTELSVIAGLQDIVPKSVEGGKTNLEKAQANLDKAGKDLGEAQTQINAGRNALSALATETPLGGAAGTFALPGSDATNASLGSLKAALDNANTLKAELAAYANGTKDEDAEKRQALLQKAKDDAYKAGNKDNGTAPAILKENDSFEAMRTALKAATPPIEIPELEPAPAAAAPATPPPAPAPAVAPARTYTAADVTKAVEDARAAILKACGAVPCQTPPAVDPAAEQRKTDAEAAAAQVKAMREAQRGYLSGIQTAVNPPAATVASNAAQEEPLD